ncbi:hypothetical protein D3C79_1030740 [compost metagenome]
MAEHAFDLMVPPLDDRQPGPARAEDVELGGQGGEVFECKVQALLERGGIVRANVVLGLDQVMLGQLGGWLGQAP